MQKLAYQCGALRVDVDNRRVTRAGVELALEPKAFAVLLQLLARPGELLTRDALLDAVWGHRYITPATLNRVMTLLRRLFEDDAAHPQFILTVHGAGYRYAGPVTPLSTAAPGAAARFGPPPVAQLPAKLEPLIGRSIELGQLGALLGTQRAVTILGPGGMGKTQCALELARQHAGDFSDGIWFFDLSPLQRAPDWLLALGAVLSLRYADEAALLAGVQAALQGRRALLLLDNCDRIAGGVGAIVFELLRHVSDIKVLATSQQRLNYLGEQLFRMPPLALPALPLASGDEGLVTVAGAPAVELLVTRACAVQPAFVLESGNARDIVEICQQLDGMPLALELAAAQFAFLSPGALVERLAQRFSLLVSDSAGRERRHRTLAALIDWSYALLSGREQELLCWLGVFQRGWTLDAAEYMGAAFGIDTASALELHSGLIAKSLVVVDPSLSPPRYRLLETVREFALQKLLGNGAERAARNAHLEYFVQLAERSHQQILSAAMLHWITRLRHEHANIDAALDWAAKRGAQDELALQLAGALMLYGKCTGAAAEVFGWVDQALRSSSTQDSPARMRALLCRGVIGYFRLAPPLPGAGLPEVADRAAQANDRWTRATACSFHICRLAVAGELAAAAPWLVQLKALTATLNDEWIESLAAMAISMVYFANDELELTLPILGHARLLSHDLHQRLFLDAYLGLALSGLGRWSEAAENFYRALVGGIEIRQVRAAAGCMEGTAYIAVSRGEWPRAARLLGAANSIRQRTGMPMHSFWRRQHEQATAAARAELGALLFTQHYAAGAAERDEVLCNEVLAYLSAINAERNNPLAS